MRVRKRIRAFCALLLPQKEIHIRCRMPEKFLERAREEQIGIMHAQCAGEDGLQLRVRGADAVRLEELAGRYSLRIVSARAAGPDPLRALCRAWPFAAGFCMCWALISALCSRVWLLDVRCPQGGEPADIRAAVQQVGVQPGAEFPQEDALACTLEGLCPGYAHISVRRDGVALLIEAYRETQEPEVYDGAAARDLVARCDAVVEQITVLAGRAAVQSGDVVRRGQVLILGEEKETDETTRGVSALGEVTGRIWAYAEAKSTVLEEKKTFTGEERVRAKLRLFGWSIPLRGAEDFDLQEEEEQRVAVGGVFLPLHIERTLLREYALVSQPADEEALRAALEARATAEAMAKLPENAQIIDKWTDYSMMEGNQLCARVCVQASMPIALARAQLEQIGNIP